MTPNVWQRFHDDMRAALRADVPMRHVDGSFLKIGQLDQYFAELNSESSSGLKLEEIQTRLGANESLPKWFVAACEVFARTGTAVPVLEGISANQEATNDANRAMRWTFVYTLLLLATALAGLVFFYFFSATAFEAFRQDLAITPSQQKDDSFNVLPFLPALMIAMAVVLAIGLISLLTIGTKRFSMWLGGKRFVRYSLSSTILRVAQTISPTGVSNSDSVRLACTLTGIDEVAEKDLEALLRGTEDDETIEQMANCQRQTAHQCLTSMKVTSSMLLVTGLGGCLAFLYCMIIFLPIISMLRDMANQAGL